MTYSDQKLYKVSALAQKGSVQVLLITCILYTIIACVTYNKYADHVRYFEFLFVPFLLVIFEIRQILITYQNVLISTDEIELIGLIGKHVLKKSELAGWQKINFRGYSKYHLIPTNPKIRDMVLPPNLQVDQNFTAWLDQFPRLTDKQKRARRVKNAN